ncbi:MAG: hypothetical protein ISS31_00440 [Kiritimatiellae bacterium]|nr:hypothetical protein [Kiritimatiellia bacterium]
MKGTVILKLCVLMAGLCVLASGAGAATFIDTFDSGNDGWGAEDYPGETGAPEANVPLPSASLGGQTALQILEDEGDAGGFTDIIFTDAGVGTSGTDLDSVVFNSVAEAAMYVTFDFWANADISDGGDTAPAALEFFFHSGSTYWRLDIIDQITAPDWNTGITVGWWGWSGAGWTQEDVGGTDDLDFETVLGDNGGDLQMGIMLTYQGFSSEEYGIDNFELHNPEPGTYAVLAFALVSLGVTFRGKLRTGIKGLLRK